MLLGSEFADLVIQLIKANSNDFSGVDIHKIFRRGQNARIREPEVLTLLAGTALERTDSTTANHMAWTLWGLARAGHILNRRDFNKMALNISEEIEVLLSMLLTRVLPFL